MYERDVLKKRAKQTRATDDWNAYSKIRSKVTYEVKGLKVQLIQKILGRYWTICRVKSLDVTDATRIANHFNEQFAQIGPTLASSVTSMTTDPKQYLNKANSSFVIKEVARPSKVKKLLEKVYISKATGLVTFKMEFWKLRHQSYTSIWPTF